jgi:hypothetical protein
MGRTTPIEPIALVAPHLTLLSASRRMNELPYATTSGQDWREGIGFNVHSCRKPDTYPDACSTAPVDEDRQKDVDCIGLAEFHPFMVLANPANCAGIHPDTYTTWDAITQQIAELGMSYKVSNSMWTGADTFETPFLQSTGRPIQQAAVGDPPTSIELLKAYDWLVASRKSCAPLGGVVVHIPNVVWGKLWEFRGDRIVTKGDTVRAYGSAGEIMVPDDGYPYGFGASNTPQAYGPLIDPLLPALGYWGQGAGEVWLYATGSIEWQAQELERFPRNYNQSDELVTNRYYAWYEGHVIYRFDPCCVKAVLAKVPDASNLISGTEPSSGGGGGG